MRSIHLFFLECKGLSIDNVGVCRDTVFQEIPQGAGFDTGYFVKERRGGLPLPSNVCSSHHFRAPSLPAVSQIPGYIEGPPPSPTYLFYSSKATEGRNRLWALRALYTIHDRGFRSAIDVCVPTRVKREQNIPCMPKAWFFLADCAFNMCQNQPVSALDERYRGLTLR